MFVVREKGGVDNRVRVRAVALDLLFADGFGVVGVFRIVGSGVGKFGQVRDGQVVLKFFDHRTLCGELAVVVVHVPGFGHFTLSGSDLIGQ